MKLRYPAALTAGAMLIPLLALAATVTAPKPAAAPAARAADVRPIIVPEEEAVISAFNSALPSVVSIVISENVLDDSGNSSPQDTGGGTGFLVSRDGYIVTNKHVVTRDDVQYTAVTNDGAEYVASVLARDPLFDIAIVKVEGSGFAPARLGDSDKIRIGQTVLAIGNALAEFRNTVTRGIVSGIGRTITASGAGMTETLEGTIQTDASINPGNSGGTLINLRGEVIGMNTAINSAGQNLGFALPVNRIKDALAKFRANGKISRAFLGVRYVMLNRTVARAYALPVTQGAYVLLKDSQGRPTVILDAPADKAGIKPGDIILELNGQKLSVQKPLSSLISQLSPGTTITLKVLRGGAEQTISVTLGELGATAN